MVKILTQDNSKLREIASEIQSDSFSSKEILHVIKDLKDALSKERFGVAIAAPQIGHSVRLFIIDAKVLNSREKQKDSPTKNEPYLFFFNPKITKVSKKLRRSVEGCLSVPGKAGTVLRHEQITVKYFDKNNIKQTHTANGFLSAVIQHEYDHLDGILYIDKAEEVHDVDENMEPVN